MDKIILASNSPRRKELLEQVGIDFEVKAASVDEITSQTLPQKVVEELSYIKARAVVQNNPGRIILAADTVVAFDGQILGKPKDEEDALRMLQSLSGRSHYVYTGVTLIDEDNTCTTFHECTEVKMYENNDDLLRRYIATGEPMDKAGAYGIQGKGAILVEKINGDYNNVVGLPVSRIFKLLFTKYRL